MLYYVMPYVEGESLRDRLTREHQLPVGDAIRIADGSGLVTAAKDLRTKSGSNIATVRTEPASTVEARRTLFSVADIVSTNSHANYDISPDGRQFVMIRRSPATRIMVIQNLPALVRRLQ